MQRANILVVKDDTDIQQLVSYNLVRAGFHVSCADSGEEALQILAREHVDCILLDLMLPKMSGLELCAAIRKDPPKPGGIIPVIMLTAKDEEEDVIKGFDSGADDYITKPFSPKVLVARIKAVIKRSTDSKDRNEAGEKGLIVLDGLTIDAGRHQAVLDGEELRLTATEFGILSLLAAKPGWVLSRQQIIDAIRGYDFLITPRAIDVQIFGLRKKLKHKGPFIETVRGIGYRFRESKERDE